MSTSVFFKSTQFAIVGASQDPSKFGNIVLKWYQKNIPKPLFPVNPKSLEIEGIKTIKELKELKNPKETSVSVITPPKVTLGIVKSCIELGIQNVWLQPGSESDEAIKIAKEHGLNIIYGGPCVLVSGLTAYEQSRL